MMKGLGMDKVKKISLDGWIFYMSEDKSNLDRHKCGKWMHFFNNKEFAVHICEEAVANGICVEAKHTNASEGVSCFYLNCDDIEGHKKVLSYFIKNDLIRKTKTGKLYNISFKLDDQTRAGEYGAGFHSEIKLEKFVNLNTGELL